ncbi:phosphoenolpyruvate carboxylase [Helicobacter suis]|uniref:phosphoenolpyruvate carboxylase n=1 Tax=Helicobacter suis TaxID=104628 RepID=UPI0013D3B7DC|nr:phosphoenolpyruvate carboxylase [Helicobacter suis]
MHQNTQLELNFLQDLLLEILQEFSPASINHFLALKELFSSSAPQEMLITQLQASIASEQILDVIKAFSLYNILANIIEERYQNKQPSLLGITQAYSSLKQEGFTEKSLQEKFSQITFYPVFTAHPTQSMRRTFLEAIYEMYQDLSTLFDNPCSPHATKHAKERLAYRLRLLWNSHLVRQEKLEVLFELDNLLYILENSLLPSCLELFQEIQEKLDQPIEHALIQLGSWIGGDRDGNPTVSNDLVRQVILIQHDLILSLYLKQIKKLRRELSISADLCPISEDLKADLEAHYSKLDLTSARLHIKEPFRAKLVLMELKLKNRLIALNSPLPIDFAYQDAQELLADITLLLKNLKPSLQRSLLHFKHLVLLGGFHLLRLDFREHREVFLYALSEVFSLLGLCSGFHNLEEDQKLEILDHALSLEPLALSTLLPKVSEECKRLLEAFLTIIWAKIKIANATFASIIVSMTTQASDLLCVLWLAKQARLNHPHQIYITPLFETINDLNQAPRILQTLYANCHYKAYLKSMDNKQEIMIGYSDSSKDGGIFASNYNLYIAISELMALGKELGIQFILFHGRGGSVSRGGGSLEDALLSAPLYSVQDTLKTTEQGEVISSRYLNATSAHKNLSNIMGALLKKSIYDTHGISPPKSLATQTMQTLSTLSYQTYRQLYTMPGFLDYFKYATPIAFIQELNLGSRPAKRKESSCIEDLRAIPWVFAWTQNRSILPAWYGVGSALASVYLEHLRDHYQEGGFFKVVLDNIAQVLLKVDLDIAKQYHCFALHTQNATQIWECIKREYQITLRLVLAVRSETKLLEKDPLIQQGILFRKPYINALNCLQIELIKVFDQADSLKQAKLKLAIESTLIGIAQGLRNTG